MPLRGLAKTRALPIAIARRTVLLRVPDPVWRSLFDRADTVSEGGVRAEAHGRVWYGSTSLILPTRAADSQLLAALASRDVHARARAVRAARREASSRAPARLGPVACEVSISHDPRGVRIDVDVQALLIEERSADKASR